MSSIQKSSKRFHMLFSMLFFIQIPLSLAMWLFASVNSADDFFTLNIPVLMDSQVGPVSITVWKRLGCFVATMLTVSSKMYIYWWLAVLFKSYSNMIIFDSVNVKSFRNIAYGILALQVLSVPTQILTSIILTINNPEGERQLYVSFDDVNVSMIVVSFILLIVAKVMDEGRKLQLEMDMTV